MEKSAISTTTLEASSSPSRSIHLSGRLGQRAIEARLATSLRRPKTRFAPATHHRPVRSQCWTRFAIPALLALSAIHQHLVGRGLRTSPALWWKPDPAREVHHFALLAGYGAEAVHPCLAMETILPMPTSRFRSNIAARRE